MEEVEGNVLEAVDVECELASKHAPEVEDVSALDLKERVLLAVVLRGGTSSRVEERTQIPNEGFLSRSRRC